MGLARIRSVNRAPFTRRGCSLVLVIAFPEAVTARPELTHEHEEGRSLMIVLRVFSRAPAAEVALG
jgi:hypothetical protein